MRSADFSRSTKKSRAANLAHLVLDGQPVGVLAYVDGVPVGWCSVAQRELSGTGVLSRIKLMISLFGRWRAFWSVAASGGAD